MLTFSLSNSAISGHPHIVKLVGAVREETRPTTLYLITEYVPDGSVHRFLQENGSQLHFRVLLEICKNAAAGMVFKCHQSICASYFCFHL